MEYLTNWTNVDMITEGGWSGSFVYSTVDYALKFVATNGWHTIGWNSDEWVGKNIILEFEYILTDTSNLGSIFTITDNSVTYGSPVTTVSPNTTWSYCKSKINSAKKFVGINIRGVDNTGKSIVMLLRNVRIHTNDGINKVNIEKNGIIKSEIFSQCSSEYANIHQDSVMVNNFYEI